MKVKEVMATQVKSILPETDVKEALDMLLSMKISGLPVIDGQGKLVGMFTEKGVLRNLLPAYVDHVGKFVYTENPKGIKNKIIELANLKVKDLMRKEVITTDEDSTLSEAARLMLTQKVRRVPVLNKEGKVTGMLAREDVLKGLLRL